MLISVVIPAYNEEKRIGACLDSLRDQEHPDFDFEVIVVDDGSRDSTATIAARRGARVIRQPNGGVAKARQTGFEAARGEIIASTDADTVVPYNWLARIAADFRADRRVVGVYGPGLFDDDRTVRQAVVRAVCVLWLGAHTALGRPAFGGFNFAVRKAAWQRAGGFNVDWASSEDVSLSLKLSRVGRVAFDRRLVVYTSDRRLRAGQLAMARLYGENYLRVFWLHKPPLPFNNIR